MKWNLNKESSPKVPTKTKGLSKLDVDQVVKLVLLGIGSVAIFGSLWYYNANIGEASSYIDNSSSIVSNSSLEKVVEVSSSVEDILPAVDFSTDRLANERAITEYEMVDKEKIADFIQNGVLQISSEDNNEMMELRVADIAVAYTGYMNDVDATLTLITAPKTNLLGDEMLQTDKDIHLLKLGRLAEIQLLYLKSNDNKVSLKDSEWLEYGEQIVENMRNGYASYSLEFGYEPGDAPTFAFASLPYLNQDMSRVKNISK